MISGSLPFRYARALVELAEEESRLMEVGEELKELARLSRAIDRLDHYLAEPVIPREVRRKTLAQILDNIGASDTIRRFCHLLLARERFAWFSEIVSAYGALADEQKGILRVQVVSAVPLARDLASRLEVILADKTGKTVAVEYVQDPSLIGGLVIHVGGVVYDGSVRGDLLRAEGEFLRRTSG